MGRWRAVVFDLDDTLYPEHEYVRSGFRAVAEWVGREHGVHVDETYAELSALFERGIRGNTFDRWLSRSTLSPLSRSLVPQLVHVYRTHAPTISPFPEIPALLSVLRGRYRLGLVSDGIDAVQRMKLQSLGLEDAFDAVVLSDALADGREAWKPSSRPFVAVATALRVAPCDAIYVADNPAKDFLGARSAGFGTIWCRHARGEYSALVPPTAGHAADEVCDSLDALTERLAIGRILQPGASG